MCNKILVVTAILLVYLHKSSSRIPNYIKTCKASDPRVSQCIGASIRDLLPKLKNGVKELDIPPIEPLRLDTIKLQNGVQSNITQLQIYGISTFKLTDLKTDIINNKFMFKSEAVKLNFEGIYDLDMQLVFIPIKGRGKIRGTLNNFHADGIMQGRKQLNHNGRQYLKFQKFMLKMHAEDAKVQLDNLFNGDKFLGELTNSVINNNINIIMDDVMPALENSIAEHLTNIANKITDKFPYDELFPR